jgi:hypothetical protein
MAKSAVVPDGVEEPEDHKAPDEDVKTVTVSGIEVTVEMASLDDWKLTKLLRKMEDDGLLAVDVAEKVFGDQLDKIEDGLADGKGRISNEKIATFLKDVLEAVAPNS